MGSFYLKLSHILVVNKLHKPPKSRILWDTHISTPHYNGACALLPEVAHFLALK